MHHSVEQLYWLNTARFHPLEKALQMSLDSLPFLLMRCDAEGARALYYVAYATNGFFQHCNIELRYGLLNYIVGSAETHRWHHSRLPRESNANYGNTVIVWDLLFGTWYLPKEREVEQLGLQDPRLSEIVPAPDARAVQHDSTDDGASLLLRRVDAASIERAYWRPVERMRDRSRIVAQQEVLRRLLAGQPRHALRRRARLRRHPRRRSSFASACRCRTTRRCGPTSTSSGARARRR